MKMNKKALIAVALLMSAPILAAVGLDEGRVRTLPYHEGEMHSQPYYEGEMRSQPYHEGEMHALPVRGSQAQVGYQAGNGTQAQVGYQAGNGHLHAPTGYQQPTGYQTGTPAQVGYPANTNARILDGGYTINSK